jgi:hypothetical protein
MLTLHSISYTCFFLLASPIIPLFPSSVHIINVLRACICQRAWAVTTGENSSLNLFYPPRESTSTSTLPGLLVSIPSHTLLLLGLSRTLNTIVAGYLVVQISSSIT